MDFSAGIEPAEDDAGIRRCRPHRHAHFLAAMQPHPLAADRGPQGPLLRNPHVPQHVNPYQNETLLARNLTRPLNRHKSLFVTDCCMFAAFWATTYCGGPCRHPRPANSLLRIEA